MTIKACFRHAIQATRVAIAFIPMTGCSGDQTAGGMVSKPAYLPSAPAAAAASSGQSEGAEGADAAWARTSESGAPDSAQLTSIELHHFNVYKSFRAMLDISSDGDSERLHQVVSSGMKDGFADFICSGVSLIKQAD